VGTPPRRCSLRGSPSDTLIGVSYVVYEKCVSRMGKQYSTSPSRRFEIDRGRSIDRSRPAATESDACASVDDEARARDGRTVDAASRRGGAANQGARRGS